MSKRLSANEVLSKKSHCERQLCLGFIRRVLGGFLEGSRHVLGRISARSRRNFASAGDAFLRKATDSPKGAQRKPKGAKRRQKEAQRQPKRAKKEAKGRPGGRKIEGLDTMYHLSLPEAIPEFRGQPFKPYFGSIFGTKFDESSCYFLASFFDRFLKASGGILGGILDDFGRSFWLHFQTLRKKAHPTNSL